MPEEIILSVSEFVEVFNQSMEVAYPVISIVGELANFRVSKNKWLYFDLKDDLSSLKFFGTVYQLPGPIEDGMMLNVKALPRLHNSYGFSLIVQTITPAGEGSIKKAAKLLKEKLTREGLFEIARKRSLPYPPERICLITSKQSAAYSDFIKILNSRWHGVMVEFIDVQVQGEAAPEQIASALSQANAFRAPAEAIVMIRGGGSNEDLAAFNSELVTRAVASSRVPTIVAVGHERDVSLAELAADRRASTPSNAAELLVPDKHQVLEALMSVKASLRQLLSSKFVYYSKVIRSLSQVLEDNTLRLLKEAKHSQAINKTVIEAYNPNELLKIGYAVVRNNLGQVVRRAGQLSIGDHINVKLYRGGFDASVNKVNE